MLALILAAALSAPLNLGGCAGTRYGCCPDNTTPRDCGSAESLVVGGCQRSAYGCCPDGCPKAPTLTILTNCTACTRVVGVLENVGPEALNATGHLFEAIADICKAIPGPSARLCGAIAADAATIVMDITRGMNATAVCHALGFCQGSPSSPSMTVANASMT